MDLKLLSQFENPLLQRKEIKIVIVSDGATPSREEIKKEACQKFNWPEETTIIRKIFQEKGTKRAICSLNIYNSKEAMLQIEAKHLLERKKKKKGEQAEEATPQPAEESKEEASEANAAEKSEEEGEVNG
jgi:small subunit ribosomal protein S24e